jgi:hypothetical protein
MGVFPFPLFHSLFNTKLHETLKFYYQGGQISMNPDNVTNTQSGTVFSAICKNKNKIITKQPIGHYNDSQN